MDYNALYEKIQQDKTQGFTELYNATYSEMKYFALKIVNNEAEAEDILQDAYIKAWNKIDTVEKPEALHSWLSVTIKRTAFNYLKKKKPSLFTDMVSENEDGDTFDYDVVDDSIESSPELSYSRKETAEMVEMLLDSLTEEQRICVVMRYQGDTKIKDIAEQLGVSENTVKSRLRYANKNMNAKAEEMKKKGYRFYGLAPLPLLALLFKNELKAYAAEGAIPEMNFEAENANTDVSSNEAEGPADSEPDSQSENTVSEESNEAPQNESEADNADNLDEQGESADSSDDTNSDAEAKNGDNSAEEEIDRSENDNADTSSEDQAETDNTETEENSETDNSDTEAEEYSETDNTDTETEDNSETENTEAEENSKTDNEADDNTSSNEEEPSQHEESSAPNENSSPDQPKGSKPSTPSGAEKVANEIGKGASTAIKGGILSGTAVKVIAGIAAAAIIAGSVAGIIHHNKENAKQDNTTSAVVQEVSAEKTTEATTKQKALDINTVLSAYETVLKDLMVYDVEDYQYALIYIDDDEIPELKVIPPMDAMPGYLIYYTDNKADYIELAKGAYLQYIEHSGLFMYSVGYVGYGSDDYVYRYKDGVAEQIAEGHYVDSTQEYTFNGKTLSMEEYDKELNKAFDKSKATDTQDVYKSFSAIIEGLSVDEEQKRRNSQNNQKMLRDIQKICDEEIIDEVSEFAFVDLDQYYYRTVLFKINNATGEGTAGMIACHQDDGEYTYSELVAMGSSIDVRKDLQACIVNGDMWRVYVDGKNNISAKYYYDGDGTTWNDAPMSNEEFDKNLKKYFPEREILKIKYYPSLEEAFDAHEK